MSRKGVLLLGGTGFIGGALARRMQQEGINVHILGRHNAEGLEQVLPKCDTVIHLASVTTPSSSAGHRGLEVGNLVLTLRLLELLQSQPDTHMIFFSSGGTVYGDPSRLPVTEESLIAPLSNHGAGKAAQEAFCEAFRGQGRALTILRLSNAYGPGQLPKPGFGLIRTMLDHACAGTSATVWGDGENVRDFIYIDDIVEATTRLVKLPEDSKTYNLGSGVGFSINQVRAMIEAVCGKELRTVYLPKRGVDVHSVVLDSSRLHSRLDWQPRIGLAEGLTRTWQWLQQA